MEGKVELKLTLKELSLWELTWGRATLGTMIIAADTFHAATLIAVDWIKKEKPEWNEVDLDDIRGLKRLDKVAVTNG